MLVKSYHGKDQRCQQHIDEDETLPSTIPVANNMADAAEDWIAQADAQFVFMAVTVSKTKFYHTVAVLPQGVAVQILNLIQDPPARTPYKVLKDRLITLHSLNDYQRFKALVSLPLSGDQQPSHFMNRMLAYIPDDYTLDFIL